VSEQYRYRWFDAQGTQLRDTNALQWRIPAPEQADFYRLEVYYAELDCAWEDTLRVLQNNAPVLDLPDTLRVCPGNTLTISAQGTYASQTWTLPDGQSTQTLNLQYSPASDRSIVKLEVANACGLQASDSVVVLRYTGGQKSSWRDSICVSGGLVALPQVPGGGNWAGSGIVDSLFDPSDLQGSVELLYSYTDGEGCTWVDTFSVYIGLDACPDVLADLDIPTGFTPNGDGVNDTWVIKNINIYYPDAEVYVFNRWGQEVFSAQGYTKPWNGTQMGKAVPDGTYFFVLKLEEELVIHKSLTIMR
jgi:gliding motility-associated-like protein